MIYPLSWLSEYTKLPKSLDLLTDKLTMIGHMLDKTGKVGSEEFIDLELRGNRPDLLGVYGMSREISAAFGENLLPLKLTPLPKTDPKSELVVIKDPDLIERFQALTLKVKVKSSPDWLKKRLACFGIPSINNVVDITNYVMLETGEPMHAFDLERLTGRKLILRRAKKGEQMTTIQGTEQVLAEEDLVLADLKKPQGLTLVGSRDSGTTGTTTEILLEAAVYKYANVRHTARRLGVHTDAGTRHEKILDPNNVQIALERAFNLLSEFAEAKPTSSTFDFYPVKRESKQVTLTKSDVFNLTSLDVSLKEMTKILEDLGCKVKQEKESLLVLVPTFRTDIDQTADLVEEVARIVGYEKIPEKQLSNFLPNQIKFPLVTIEDRLKDILILFGLKETINLSIIPNKDIKTFEVGGKYPPVIKLLNSPDPDIATLRPSLIPGLVRTMIKAANFKQTNLTFFEVGKTFFKDSKDKYYEQDKVAIILPLNKTSDQMDYSQALGIVKFFLKDLGVEARFTKQNGIPSLDPNVTAKVEDSSKKEIGYVGLLNPQLSSNLKLGDIFVCEIVLDKVIKDLALSNSSYFLYPPYPAIYEDMTFEVTKESELGDFTENIYKISDLIKEVKLVGTFNKSRSFRITYQDPTKTVSSSEVKPLREKIVALSGKHGLQLKN